MLERVQPDMLQTRRHVATNTMIVKTVAKPKHLQLINKETCSLFLDTIPITRD